jgi:hypothetical protein
MCQAQSASTGTGIVLRRLTLSTRAVYRRRRPVHYDVAVLVSDFDFPLPPEQIAQAPPSERGTSRLLVL